MIQAVLFDMDGLMFDTERLWGTFWAPALAKFGLSYKDGLDEAARGTAGETLRAVLQSYYGPDCPADAILDEFHRLAIQAFQKPVPKKPGLDELLAWLDGQQIPMAVVSSSSEAVIRRNLDNWGLGHYFRAIVAGEMVSRSKPDPASFLLGAEKLGIAPACCLPQRGAGRRSRRFCHRHGARPDAGHRRDAGAVHHGMRQPVRGAGQAQGR